MPATKFEQLVDDAIMSCAKTSIELPLNSPFEHAKLKGEVAGLRRALKIFRDEANIDADPDGDKA